MNLDPIIEQAIVAIAARDGTSAALAALTLTHFLVESMVAIAGEENTRGWCRLVIDDAVRNKEQPK